MKLDRESKLEIVSLIREELFRQNDKELLERTVRE